MGHTKKKLPAWFKATQSLFLSIWPWQVVLAWEQASNFDCSDLEQEDATEKIWEKVTTTKIRTSKTKKNIKKFVNHHYIESIH